MRACLSQFVKRKLPVIPVLLPGTPAKPELPLFLQSFTWVDLRDGLTDLGLEKLVWGITGVKQTKPASGRRDTPIKNYKKNRIFKELLGNYILYFPRPHQSENDFIKSPLKIYSSLNGKLKAELKIREFLYKGIVEIHDGTIFIDLISSYSKTHFVAYLVRKIGIHTVLEGVHLSRSRRRMPIVSKIIAEETPFEFEYTDSEFVYKTNLPDDIKEYFNSKNLIIYQFIQTE